jgi:hypothetical protein
MGKRRVRLVRRVLDGAADSRSFPGMNARTERVGKARRGAAPESHESLKFSPINGVLLVLGLAAIVLGYVLLAQGSITAAPLLLVLGYAVLLPLAIIL